MSNNPFLPKPNDLAIKFVSNSSPTDPRTVLAEEFSLNSQLAITLFKSGRKTGWDVMPEITITGARTIRVQGIMSLSIHPQLLSIDEQIIIPSLPNNTTLVKRDDIVSVIGLVAEVGEEQDELLGRVGFKYEDTLTNTIKVIEKENARRFRSFWLLALADRQITEGEIWDLLTENIDIKQLEITNTENTGFTLGDIRLYALDPNWTVNTYTIIPETIEVAPVCGVGRFQNYKDDGYIYGNNGEDPLSLLFISNLAKSVHRKDINTAAYERLIQIAKGIPGKGVIRKRSVKNLIPGEYGSNVGRPGAASDSPNGAICIANDQRITFSNQNIAQKSYVLVATANTDGTGRAIIGAGINTNAPLNTKFSSAREDHKVYSLDGREQSDTGKFSNLGGAGSLNWVSGNNSSISPGDKVLFVPCILYPAGSGLDLAFSVIEKAWINGSEISSSNIRDGYANDISAYEDPENNESYIVVYGTERAAIHYIYKKLTITANSNGVATVPTSAEIHQGCLAFVEGVPGRLDAPIVTNLTAGQEYKALMYYPPKYNEVWQFQVVSCQYQGLINQEPDFLEGATIVTQPRCYMHSSGGGLSVHRGDKELAKSLIAMRMPRVNNPAHESYTFDNPIYFNGEQYPGPLSWRDDIPLWAAPNFVFPSIGQKLSIVDRSASILPYSLNAKLFAEGGQIGVRVPNILSQGSFQAIISFVAAKGDEVKLVVVTQNIKASRPHNIIFDSSEHTAIDIFNI